MRFAHQITTLTPALLCGALLSMPFTLLSASRAQPRLSTYVTSGTLNSSVETCLSQMKTAAIQAGITQAQQLLMDQNNKAGDFHSERFNPTLHFTARCNSVSKTWAAALSGTEANTTFTQFKAITKEIFKK
mgnify:FL=1